MCSSTMRALLVVYYTLCVSVLTICGDDAEMSSSRAASDTSEYLELLTPSQEYGNPSLYDMIEENKRRKKYRPEYDDDLITKWVAGAQFKQKEIDCLVGDGKCRQKLADIKKTIINALADGCKSCSMAEKKAAGSTVALMMFKQPEVWKQFLVKHDVNNTFMKQYS